MDKYYLFALFLAVSPVIGADAYKWTDADGRVHYGDQPPVDIENSKINVGPHVKGDKQSPDTQPAPEVQQQQEPPAVAQAPNEPEDCTVLMGKLEKYKNGQIDFSYETESGRKITPARVKVIKAYEDAIAEACG